MTNKKIVKLIIPDTHIKPNESLERIKKLSNLAYQLKPDYIICMGDFADMESLSSYDKFKASTYKADIETTIKAQEIFAKPWKFNKKKRPKMFRLIGNHEQRINTFAADYPEFKDFISLNDLQYSEHNWEVVEYNGKHPGILDLEGILYAHYFNHQNTPHAISGKYHANALLDKKHMSCTAAHSHLFDYKIASRGDGKMLQGLVGGCFFEGFKAFAGNSNYGWWRGVHIKRLYKDEPYDLQSISLNHILKEF